MSWGWMDANSGLILTEASVGRVGGDAGEGVVMGSPFSGRLPVLGLNQNPTNQRPRRTAE